MIATSITFDPIGERFEIFEGSPFVELFGPVWRRKDAPPTFALRLETRHANASRTTHGGVLMGLVDMALGHGVRSTFEGTIRLVTASLTADFARPVAIGSWIKAQADVQYRSERTAFASCFVMSDGERAVHASAVSPALNQ
jgi:acyl-coenzyme A thioesterase 13